MEKTKICKYCQSAVDIKCKKCPVCKEWISYKSNPGIYSIIIGIGVLFFFSFYSDKNIKSTAKKYESQEFQSAEYHHLKILWNNPQNNEGSEKYIIGELKNEGKDTFSSISVEASFYDKDKNLIKIGSAYLTGNISPGSTKKFEITYSCGQCDIKKMYDSYELEIIDGSMPFRY
jgi:hypothetical protein